MKIQSKIALVIAVVALLCVVGWTSKAERPSRTDWEYKAITVWTTPDAPVTNLKQLNDMGGEGWEMVTVMSEDVLRGSLRQSKLTCYFKRPL